MAKTGRSIRIDDELWTLIQQRAEEQDRSASYVVNDLLQIALSVESARRSIGGK